MARRSGCLLWLCSAVVLWPALARAQAGVLEAPPASVDVALQQMASRAGVIFAGQVVAVRRHVVSSTAGGAGGTGVVEIEFRVDQAVRGCSAGESFVVREWAGLWEGGAQRYRVGQRLLMLLHGRGAAGFSSPVNGMRGAIPIVPGEAALAVASAVGAEAGGGATVVAGPAPMRVDLRWVETAVYRVVETVPEVAPHGPALSSAALRGVAGQAANTATALRGMRALAVVAGSSVQAELQMPVVPGNGSKDMETSRRPLSAVLSMLAGGGGQHAAR